MRTLVCVAVALLALAVAPRTSAMPFPTWEVLSTRDPLCHFTTKADGSVVCDEQPPLSVYEPKSNAPRNYRCQQVFTNFVESGCIAVPSNELLVAATVFTTDH